MEQTAVDLTRYFRDIQERSNLVAYDFDSSAPYCEAPLAVVESGILDPATTAELYQFANDSSAP